MLARRQLEAEWLDVLPASEPRAQRARRDLRLVNFLMGHRSILRRHVLEALPSESPHHIIELGAGDGTLMLALAGDLAADWPGVTVEFIDQQDLVLAETRAAFGRLGWKVECVNEDLVAWARRSYVERADLMLANLVLHHFSDASLRELFAGIARRANLFIAVEPRRSRLALAGGRALGLVGCNDVTRHDAVASVRAGFAGADLSRLWPEDKNWRLSECPAGLFSHLFQACHCPVPEGAA